MRRMNCDVCGHDLRDEDGYITAGLRISLTGCAETSEGQRTIDTFDKIKFDICYVCWLKSLGVKEPKKPTPKTGQSKDPVEAS